MSTWIAWPPDKTKDKFPKNFDNNALNQYQTGIDEEKCPECGFTVKFISDKNAYENWNDHTHVIMREILARQEELGKCPSHNKPNWIA